MGKWGRPNHCGGKTSYPSEHQARNSRKAVYKQGRKRRLRVYPCRACGGWHLTSEVGNKAW